MVTKSRASQYRAPSQGVWSGIPKTLRRERITVSLQPKKDIENMWNSSGMIRDVFALQKVGWHWVQWPLQHDRWRTRKHPVRLRGYLDLGKTTKHVWNATSSLFTHVLEPFAHGLKMTNYYNILQNILQSLTSQESTQQENNNFSLSSPSSPPTTMTVRSLATGWRETAMSALPRAARAQ